MGARIREARRAFNILRLGGVENATGLGHSSIYQKMADGTFPLQVKLGRRAVGWIDYEIQDWLQARVEQSRRVSR